VNAQRTEPEERARQLMMAGLDGELSGNERAELDRLLAADEALGREWQRFKRVREVTASMRYSEPPAEVWEDYWTSVYSRTERRLGWLLMTSGLTVVFGWAAWHWIEMLLRDSSLPGYIRVAIFAIVFGLVILLVSVAREKFFVRRHDPYKEIQR